jgi:hypothetical protein
MSIDQMFVDQMFVDQMFVNKMSVNQKTWKPSDIGNHLKCTLVKERQEERVP